MGTLGIWECARWALPTALRGGGRLRRRTRQLSFTFLSWCLVELASRLELVA